jgi:hypothetical protein
MEKLIKTTVELTQAQLSYLEDMGYFLRARPDELLVALAFGAIDPLEGLGAEKTDSIAADLLNYVVERRVPEMPVQVLSHGTRGQFTCKARRARRAKIDGEPEVAA